jgi:DNA-binding HxlR family transcriptional regulator
MPKPPLDIPKESLVDIETHISATIANGGHIRGLLAGFSDKPPWSEEWEVKAAVEALHVFGSRWTTEILAALYITGGKRFNRLKNLLTGISSRTLSDKLRFLVDEGLVVRDVYDGPPIMVEYNLTSHGKICGKLLSPLVAHLKIKNGSINAV